MDERYVPGTNGVDPFGLESPFAGALEGFAPPSFDAPTAPAAEGLGWLDFEGQEEWLGGVLEAPGTPGPAQIKPLLGGSLWSTVDKPLRTKVTTFVTPAALGQRHVEVLLYVHGLLSPCGRPRHGMESLVAGDQFRLAVHAVASGRPIVLIVPQFQDGDDKSWRSRGIGRPQTLNRFLAAALLEVGKRLQIAAPTVAKLMVAGHSRAYGVLYELAASHASAKLKEGAAAALSDLWLLDATYGTFPKRNFTSLLAAVPALKVAVVYRAKSLTDKFGGKATGGRLALMPLPARAVSHCAIPGFALGKLLAGETVAPAPPAATERYREAAMEEERWQDFAEDLAFDEAEGEQGEGEGFNEAEGWKDESESFDEVEGWQDETLFAAEQDGWQDELEELDELAEGDFEGEAFGYHENELDELGAGDFEGEDTLAAAGLTPAEFKALSITSTLETGRTGGFYGLTGNFDGQGLSFGLVNWTIGTGSLQPLLQAFAKEQPRRWAAIFGPHAQSFLQTMTGKTKADIKRQHAFAVAEMNEKTVVKGKTRWRIKQPWEGYFRALSEDGEFRKIQVRFVRDLLKRADTFCRQFGLTSERAYCFMFDAVSSHGKWWLTKKINGRPERELRLKAKLAGLKLMHRGGRIPEDEVLLAIAEVLSVTSAARWRDKVLERKRWFVTGNHRRAKELKGLEPRGDVPYTVGSANETFDEAWNQDEPSGEGEAGDRFDEWQDEDGDGLELEEEDAAVALNGEYAHGDEPWQPKGPVPAALPISHPVPFAPLPPIGSVWPVRTSVANKRLVSHYWLGPDKKLKHTGADGRCFLAKRRTKRTGPLNRWHVGIDIYARRNDPVFACEAGTIVGFSFFYKARSGQRTFRLMVYHPGSGTVVNYGEVRQDSLSRNQLKVGSQVQAGQQIGFVSDTDMIHFETYAPGKTKAECARTTRWMMKDKIPPGRLRNPTRYLLYLNEIAPAT